MQGDYSYSIVLDWRSQSRRSFFEIFPIYREAAFLVRSDIAATIEHLMLHWRVSMGQDFAPIVANGPLRSFGNWKAMILVGGCNCRTHRL